jgi:hypothetical protein
MRRSLVLNLRIRSDDSERLGVDRHICELQLTLKSFAKLMVSPVPRVSQPERDCIEHLQVRDIFVSIMTLATSHTSSPFLAASLPSVLTLPSNHRFYTHR